MPTVNPPTALARLERLPISAWHRRLRWVIGGATFFDAFDAMMVSLTLPLLSKLWQLNTGEIGALIAVGYAGQAVGAVVFGRLSERIGRIPSLQISIFIFALMSLASAIAGSYPQMFAFRLLAGFGLGGEMPVGATYISEFAPSKARGRYFLLYEMMFPIGFVAASLLGAAILPRVGWRPFYAIGGLPILLIILIRRYCPESPRWLIANGRTAAAERIVSDIETTIWGSTAAMPPLTAVDDAASPLKTAEVSDWRELFRGLYRRRTLVVWVLWAATYSIVYGAVGWIPSLLQNTYHLPLQQALNLNFASTVIVTAGNVACALLIDRVGRGRWFKACFVIAALGFLILALFGGAKLPAFVVIGFSSLAVAGTVSFSLYLYTPEIYPTRMRATGVSVAAFWMRVASVAAPLAVGGLLPRFGVSGVFAYFAAAGACGALVCFGGGIVDAAGRRLEDISP